MNKFIIPIVTILFLISCSKDQPKPEVTFKLNISGFQITTKEFGKLKSEADTFDTFTHKYPVGTLVFINSDEVTYTFNTGETVIDSFSITLPVGKYKLSGTGMDGNRLDRYSHGKARMALEIAEQEINITETTTQINVTVTPQCGLFLVYDPESLINIAYIDSGEYPFFIDGFFRYSYFQPTSGYRAYIVKNDGAVLDILTGNLNIGYIYEFIVTNSGTSQSLNLNPGFTALEPVVW